MSDQAEKLRERMRKLTDPIKDMSRIAIVGAQPEASVALFSYNLARRIVNQEGPVLILEEESDTIDEAFLTVLLDLGHPSKTNGESGESRLFNHVQMRQKEGISILSLPFSQSERLQRESAYTELSTFLGKQSVQHHTLLWVQYSYLETEFQKKVAPICQFIVTRGEPTDLVSAYTIIKELHAKNNELEIGVVITHSDNDRQALSAFETLNAVAIRFLEKKLSYCGSLTKKHGEPVSMMADWFGHGSDTGSIYDECRRFIFQKTMTT